MEFLAIENNLDNALSFESCGVERIFVDLEILGKKERQGHLNTVISNHDILDVKKLKSKLTKSKLLVRVNPINPASEEEISRCIDYGADIIMLPMFTSAKEVESFLKFTNNKVKTSLLLETPQAAIRIDEVLALGSIDEIHIGLNDLSISFGLKFMMEMYLGGFLENLCNKITAKSISLGIGGVAPLESGLVSGRMIISEAYRLGSERTILSRAFPKDDIRQFQKNLSELKDFISGLNEWGGADFENNKQLLTNKIIQVRDKLNC